MLWFATTSQTRCQFSRKHIWQVVRLVPVHPFLVRDVWGICVSLKESRYMSCLKERKILSLQPINLCSLFFPGIIRAHRLLAATTGAAWWWRCAKAGLFFNFMKQKQTVKAVKSSLDLIGHWSSQFVHSGYWLATKPTWMKIEKPVAENQENQHRRRLDSLSRWNFEGH